MSCSLDTLEDLALEAICGFLEAGGFFGAAAAVGTARGSGGWGRSARHKDKADGSLSSGDTCVGVGFAERLQELSSVLLELLSAVNEGAADAAGLPLAQAESGGDNSASRARTLGGSRGGRASAREGRSGSTGDWVDGMLKQIATSGGACRATLGEKLLARLDRAVASSATEGSGPAAGATDLQQKCLLSGDRAATAKSRASSEAPGGCESKPNVNPHSDAAFGAKPATRTAPSTYYVPKQPGGPPDDNFDPSLPDEYRDDHDPGFRVREIFSTEFDGEGYDRAISPVTVVTSEDAGSAFSTGLSLAAKDPGIREEPFPLKPTQDAGAAQPHDGLDGVVDDDELLLTMAAAGGEEETFSVAEPGPSTPSGPSGSGLSGFMRNASSKVLAALGVGGPGPSPSSPTSCCTAASATTAAGAGSTDEALRVRVCFTAPEAEAAPGAPGHEHGAHEQVAVTGAVPAFGVASADRPAAPADAADAAGAAATSPLDQEAGFSFQSSPEAAALTRTSSSGPGLGLAAQARACTAMAALDAPCLPLSAPVAERADAAPRADAGPTPGCAPFPLCSEPKKARRDGSRLHYADSGDLFYPAEIDGTVYDSFSLRVVYERDRTGFEESKDFPIRINSIVAARYQVLEYIGSAAFSRAVQCLDLHTNSMVCMKIIKNEKDFLDQSLDEIKVLKLISANTDCIDDKSCLQLIDTFYHKEHLIIITELLRDNLYEFSKFNREHRECGDEPYFTLGRLQRISKQVLTALEYVHRLWLIHADLKPENILIKSYSRCEVKVIDFGSSCFVDDQLTSYVQSRSYRAPEVILGLPYDQKVDIWSLGCIIAELWTGVVLFQNDCVQSLLARVIGTLGDIPHHMMAAGRFTSKYFTPQGQLFREGPELRRFQEYLPKRTSLRQRLRTLDEEFLAFLSSLLNIDPAKRPTAAEALQHPWLAPGRYPTDGLPPDD